MAFHLIHADGHALLASDRPLVRASERGALEDGAALLAETRRLHDEQESRVARACADAAAAGRLVGEQAGQAAFADAIAELVRQADLDRDRREAEIAALALAALRQMAGQLAEGELMAGIARRAVESVGSRGPLVVEIAPAMRPDIERALATLPPHVEVVLRDDAALRTDQCRLTAPDGRIIADLAVQLDAFARRWETAHAR